MNPRISAYIQFSRKPASKLPGLLRTSYNIGKGDPITISRLIIEMVFCTLDTYIQMIQITQDEFVELLSNLKEEISIHLETFDDQSQNC